MPSDILEVKNLSVGYGEAQVLRDVSLRLGSNERVGLFGPNGHGKTTLLRTISGLVQPWGGEIVFKGADITGLPPRLIVGQGLIHVSQGNTLFPRMTVRENLVFASYPKKAWPQRRRRLEEVFDLFPRLAERRNQLCRTLSGGERQMLAIGMGLMAEVEVLMLDEPTLGLAPLMKDLLSEAIAKIAARGVPLVLVEQDVEFMVELTDRYYLIEGGRVALEGAAAEVDNEEVLRRYFGHHTGQA